MMGLLNLTQQVKLPSYARISTLRNSMATSINNSTMTIIPNCTPQHSGFACLQVPIKYGMMVIPPVKQSHHLSISTIARTYGQRYPTLIIVPVLQMRQK